MDTEVNVKVNHIKFYKEYYSRNTQQIGKESKIYKS